MNEDEKLTEENDLEDYDTVEVEQKDKQETKVRADRVCYYGDSASIDLPCRE